MSNKFKVYAQVRATRQLAGDVAEKSENPVVKQDWQEIEDLLNAIECKLENMDLKEDA